jgi:hypothetical protein
MATPDVIKKITDLAKKGKNTSARNLLDQELAKLAAIKDEDEKKKQKKEFLDLATKELKEAGSSIIYVLKGDALSAADIVYDAFGETMEPMYYWMLDFLREQLGYNVEKPADFFAASEASGYFGELGGRRTALEKRAVELLGTTNAVIKSVINLLWDLKTFDIRLKHYDDLKDKDADVRKSAVNALKGIWLNEVDKAKGTAALDVLATQLNFVTIRDAFMTVPVWNFYVENADRKKMNEIREKVVKHVEAMDLPEVVRRILSPRAKEFAEWLYLSEKELRNRRSVEKAYLKAQVNTLKVYTNWARPYLIATQKLIPAEYKDMMQEHKELGLGPAAIPSPFHAMWFYLELWGTKKSKITDVKPPYYAKELELENEGNRPQQVIEVRLAFRGSPAMAATGARGERGVAYTGKTYAKFNCYVMTSDHLKLLGEKRDSEILQFIDIMTTETLEALNEEIKGYLEEKPAEPEAKKRKVELPFPKVVKDAWGSMRKFNEEARKLYQKLPKSVTASKDAWKVARLLLVANEKSKKDHEKLVVNFKKSHQMLTAK